MIVLAQRGWQALSGLLTLYLVANYLSLEEQGVYYTITTLVGVLLSLDIGLTNILVPFFAANRSSHLNDENILGIAKYALRWFFWTGLLIILISPLGLVFLDYRNFSAVNNIALTWSVIVLFASASYMISPLVLLLEGIGMVNEVYIHRLYQGVLGSIAMWLTLFFGGGILSVVVPSIVCFLYTFIWFGCCHFDLVSKIQKSNIKVSWREKIWPIQWRTGGNIFSGYLLVFIYTPICYFIFGAKEAGQVGLTMACLNTIFVISISGLVSSFPRLTRLLSENKKNDGLSLYRIELKKAGIIYVLLSACMIFFLLIISNDPMAFRFMSLGQVICISIGMMFYMFAAAQGYFMRAHLLDRALGLNLLTLCIMVVSVCAMTYLYGLWGISISILLVFSGFLFPGMSRIIRTL